MARAYNDTLYIHAFRCSQRKTATTLLTDLLKFVLGLMDNSLVKITSEKNPLFLGVNILASLFHSFMSLYKVTEDKGCQCINEMNGDAKYTSQL